MDKDGSGDISKDESRKYEVKDKAFDRVDGDSNQKLTFEEFNKLQGAEEFMDEGDADKKKNAASDKKKEEAGKKDAASDKKKEEAGKKDAASDKKKEEADKKDAASDKKVEEA